MLNESGRQRMLLLLAVYLLVHVTEKVMTSPIESVVSVIDSL